MNSAIVLVTLALLVRKGIITESEMYDYIKGIETLLKGLPLNDVQLAIDKLIK
jgi:hypothetical protein